MKTLLFACCLIFCITVPKTSHSGNPCTPIKVEVLPVLFVPGGGVAPTQDQKDKLMRHFEWSQTRYFEMLNERSTFLLSDISPFVFYGAKHDVFYKAESDRGAGAFANELLNHFNYSRFECPYIFVVIYVNPDPSCSFPRGAGRPINAGFNTGGGIVIMSSYDLNIDRNFQSTLQHELGHSFGLPHVNAYGYDMETNESIMSYNRTHWTNGFTPSPSPGILIPEDIRGLALNKLVFPELYFDPDTDIPDSYTIHPNIPTLGVFPIPNQHDYAIKVTANVNAAFNTLHANLVQGQIRPNGVRTNPLQVTFHAGSMWHSPLMPIGERIVINLLFPIPVTLDKISLHSQHSGFIHPSVSIEIQVMENVNYKTLVDKAVSSADQWFEFEASTSDSWRVFLEPGETNYAVIRGLQFYYLDEGVFPPIIPYDYENPFINQLPTKPFLNTPTDHEEITQSQIELTWSGLWTNQYRIQVDSTTNFCDPIVNTVSQYESFHFVVPEKNKKYYFRVKGLNEVAHGFGSWSSMNSFFVFDNTSSDIQGLFEKDIIIYPNPSLGDFSISAKETISEINIIDRLGRNVFFSRPKHTQINCSLERSGVYFINLTTLNGVQTRKIIISSN